MVTVDLWSLHNVKLISRNILWNLLTAHTGAKAFLLLDLSVFQLSWSMRYCLCEASGNAQNRTVPIPCSEASATTIMFTWGLQRVSIKLVISIRFSSSNYDWNSSDQHYSEYRFINSFNGTLILCIGGFRNIILNGLYPSERCLRITCTMMWKWYHFLVRNQIHARLTNESFKFVKNVWSLFATFPEVRSALNNPISFFGRSYCSKSGCCQSRKILVGSDWYSTSRCRVNCYEPDTGRHKQPFMEQVVCWMNECTSRSIR